MKIKTKVAWAVAGLLVLGGCSTVHWRSGSQNADEARAQCANEVMYGHVTQANSHQYMKKCMESQGYGSP